MTRDEKTPKAKATSTSARSRKPFLYPEREEGLIWVDHRTPEGLMMPGIPPVAPKASGSRRKRHPKR